MSFFSSMFFTRFKSFPHTFVVELSVRSFSRLVRLEFWIVTRFVVFSVVVVVVAVSRVEGVVTAVKLFLLFRLLKHFWTSDRLLSQPPMPPPLDVGVAGVVGRFRHVFFSPTLCISFTTSTLVTVKRASFCCCLLFWHPSDGVSLGEFILAVECDDDMIFWKKKRTLKLLVWFSSIKFNSTHFICVSEAMIILSCEHHRQVRRRCSAFSCLMWKTSETCSRVNGQFSKYLHVFIIFIIQFIWKTIALMYEIICLSLPRYLSKGWTFPTFSSPPHAELKFVQEGARVFQNEMRNEHEQMMRNFSN